MNEHYFFNSICGIKKLKELFHISDWLENDRYWWFAYDVIKT